MWTLLYGRTYNLKDTLGGGYHRHIRLVMRDMLYTTILPTPYDEPVEPGGTATVTLQSTTVQRSQLQYEYAEACCIHGNHHNMVAAPKQWLSKQ